MQLVIGADHRGFLLKNELQKGINDIAWIDIGSYDDRPTDYPLVAHKAAKMVVKKQVFSGVLLCGSGIGMSIVANRYPGIRAALVWSSAVAKQSKEHDNANVLVFPADYISVTDAIDSFYAWHSAVFLGGKYEKRVKEIDQLLYADSVL
jgi:ribose 5-phosphate isomerase B